MIYFTLKLSECNQTFDIQSKPLSQCEVNFRKFRNHLSRDKRVFDISQSENFGRKIRNRFRESAVTGSLDISHSGEEKKDIPSVTKEGPSKNGKEEPHPSVNILQSLEKLNLESLRSEESEQKIPSGGETASESDLLLGKAKEAVDFSSGDVGEDFCFNLSYGAEEHKRIMESRRRSVQWKSEVDVIYYAGDSNGGFTLEFIMEY